MPLYFTDHTAILVGVITIEDTEPLTAWLRCTASPQVDLGGCTDLHTAALQALMVAKVKLTSPPADMFLEQFVAQVFDRTAPADSDTDVEGTNAKKEALLS